MKGIAGANAEMKGAETRASKAAEFPFTQVKTQIGNRDVTVPGPVFNQSFGLGPDGQRLPAQSGQQDGYQQSLAALNIPFNETGSGTSAKSYLPGQTLGGNIGKLGLGADPVVTKASESVNQNFLDKDYTPVIEQGKTATITINQAQIARKALEGMGGTNWAKPAVAVGAKILNVIGVPNAEKVAANAELFESTLYNHVLNKQLDQKGPQTESDAKRMSMTYAQLRNTTKANEFLLSSIEAQARIEKMREEFYRKALPIAQKDGDLAAVGREWANRQPSLFDMPSMTKFK
jgi:hypothetical protein